MRRVLLASIVGSGIFAGSYYAAADDEERLAMRTSLLAVKRTLRVCYCWTKLGSPEYADVRKRYHERGAKWVLNVCRKNGGIYIKMGQHASSLRPAIPQEYVDALTILQDRAPQRDIDEVILVLKKELSPELANEIINGLEVKPLGSASLAQVHKCKLHDGSTVAVKVQHAGLKKVMESDLQVLKALDWAASKLFPEDDYSLAWAVREFETNLHNELNFILEADNGMRMRDLILRHGKLKHRVIIPKVDRARSTGRILTMEYIDGTQIKNCEEQDKRYLAETVLDLFSAMIFTFGFIHCDPHFGNFLISKEEAGQPPKLALLDHGLYRELDERFKLEHAHLWQGMIAGDSRKVRTAALNLGAPQYADLFPLLLTNRPLNSSARIGEPIPKTELLEAKKVSGFAKGATLSQFATFADGVPVDMLFVLRTMHLVKDLHHTLHGTNRDRFLAYARAAAACPDQVPPMTWSGRYRVWQFESVFYLGEVVLRLQNKVKDWLWGRSEIDPKNSRFSLSQMIGEKMDGALHTKTKRKKFWDRFRRKKVVEEPSG